MKSNDQTLQVEIAIASAKGRKGGCCPSPSVPKVPDAPSIPRITRLMALAIKFHDMVERGAVRDYADLARLGYVTRARVTQIMNLLLLAPDIQEQILFMDPSRNVPAMTEHELRSLAHIVEWAEQGRRFMTSRENCSVRLGLDQTNPSGNRSSKLARPAAGDAPSTPDAARQPSQ